ncbi:MAG: transglutaminase-like domain-containing protein [Candidatus Cloacimonadales bacterium]
MRKYFLLFFLFYLLQLAALSPAASQRIEKYAGNNASHFQKLLKSSDDETALCLEFLLENVSPNDLAMLSPQYLSTNVEYALKSKDLPFSAEYDQDIFLHFVLPHRVSQEPLEEWRPLFYQKLKPLVAEVDNIEAAAILVNLWAYEQMSFQPTHGRDQAPLTTMKRGFGRCEETMIFVISALRAVGIPARPASAPYWNFTDNNHAWIEVWTADGWKYMGEPENALNRAWFSPTTKRSTLIQAQAMGNYDDPTTIKQQDNVTTLSSIQYYADYQICTIEVKENNLPLPDAKITLYATSYGGLFPLQTLQTDAEGKAQIPLGKGTVWVTAFKAGKFAAQKFDLLQQQELKLDLTDNLQLDETLQFHFPLPQAAPKDSTEIWGEEFYLKRQISNLQRQARLASQQQAEKFVRYYDQAQGYAEQTEYYQEREKFLEKSNQLAANSDDFLFCLENAADLSRQKILIEMIQRWDIKELVEIADSTQISQVADIYLEGKEFYREQVADSLFYQDVLGFTWRSATPPQNGWQGEFYQKIKPLRSRDIEQTVQNVINWVDTETKIDPEFSWTYFSGALNPLNILQQKNIPTTYRLRLLNSALKILGIPVRWQGKLQYYDGENFTDLVQPEETQTEQAEFSTLRLKIFVDDIQVQAEPWTNFQIAKLDKESGIISPSYYQGEADSLDFLVEYLAAEADEIYLQSFIRNSNGDSDIRLLSLENQTEVKIKLSTPRQYLDRSEEWSATTVENLQKIKPAAEGNYQLIFVRGAESNEPEIRLLQQLLDIQSQLQEKSVEFTIYSQNRDNSDLNYPNISYQSGKNIISEELESSAYPLIFIFDQQQELIFSSQGFNLSLPQLILSKLK